jgi:ATP-dependent RNA helicase SUPV3L1/SUV3
MTEIAHAPTSRRTALGHSVIAVLGPTNTGKTHLAIERMLGHESGLIGLPLRLLAREVYDKVITRVGDANVALITGEEKIKPERPRYWVCTVEAMPRDIDVDFLAIDEVQLAADPERGHVFTERLFSARGQSETLLLGASTMEGAIRDLLPGANFITRHRLSKLTYSGQKKITRLPRRSAIVAFSVDDVYTLAELIRRQRGGAAVVLGALSPRTRNAQVELYQSGDVDFLVATDAIGMGLNLDLDHVAFAATRKFDGRNHRDLSPSELGQIAGRAGRHVNDGTFGVTADVEPFTPELINRLENHEFEAVKILQWRNASLNFSTLDGLKDSLRETPSSPRLSRARAADDVLVLDTLSIDPVIRDLARSPAAIKSLWEICQLPDYRKISTANHSELVGTLYKHLMSDAGVIPEDWFSAQVALADRTDGDIDTLSNRIAHIRTWTFVSNRTGWLADTEHWRERTRAIEDNLSDALHELLTQRFVDRRTSVLMKTMRDKDTLYADIEHSGQIFVEKHYVGKLEGFRFTPDTAAAGVHGKAARHAAAKVLAVELADRAGRLCEGKDQAFKLEPNGAVSWEGQEVGRLEASEDPLRPGFSLVADEHLPAPDKDRIVKRVEAWLCNVIETRIKPLCDLSKAEDVTGLARGIAFRLIENFGILRRESVSDEIRSLDQQARAELRKFGVRFGAYNIYFPLLLKPAAADLLLLLWALKNGPSVGINLPDLPEPPRQGLTSVAVDKNLPEAFYRAAGFQVCGPRAIRIDMLERLADQIRPLTSWRPGADAKEPPAGAVGRGGFKIQAEMLSIIGCSSEEMGNVLFALGFRKERRLAEKKPEATASAEAVQAEVAAGAPEAAAQTAVKAASTGQDAAQAQPAETPGDEIAQPVRALSEDAAATDSASHLAAFSASAGDAERTASFAVPAASGGESENTPSSQIAGEAETPAVQAEPEYENIWRPRRKAQNNERHHANRRSDRSHHARRNGKDSAQTVSPEASADDKSSKDRPRKGVERYAERNHNHQRRQSNRHGGKPRSEPVVKSASPPSNRTLDQDSPFAALLKLKERMSRETQDQA